MPFNDDPDTRHIDLGHDGPDQLYLCTPDRLVLIVNTARTDDEEDG